MGTELAKTQYQVGEEISVKPYLINMGKRPITVFSDDPFLLVKVYDADNRRVLLLPEVRLLIIIQHILSPGVPYNEEAYTFTLDQPGRYKVIAWAEFSFDEGYRYPERIYADPIWIEVAIGSN